MEGEFGELEVDPFPGENLSTGRRIPGDLINGMEDFAQAIPRVRRNDAQTNNDTASVQVLSVPVFDCWIRRKSEKVVGINGGCGNG